MTETLDTYTAGTSPEDFAEADMPEVVPGSDADEAAPWGYTIDAKTGERRPKNAPGRPRKQATADELSKAPPLAREADAPPQRPAGHKPAPVTPSDDGPPMPRGGQISKGVNKIYRNTGKLIRGIENGDPDGIGQAFITSTKVDAEEPEDERSPTVGEAWEQLARSNPRIRAFLLKLVAGGDIADLVMAHAPIGVAIVMKPWIQRIIHPGAILESFAEPDEDEEEGTALPGGLTREDLQEMNDLTQSQMRDIARKTASGMGLHLSDADLERAMKQADASVPAAFRRQQPKKQTRAQRTGASR